MSISCQFCNQKINDSNVNKPIVFSLGELVNGEFLEKETLYYHIECLNNDKSYKRKKKVAVQV